MLLFLPWRSGCSMRFEGLLTDSCARQAFDLEGTLFDMGAGLDLGGLDMDLFGSSSPLAADGMSDAPPPLPPSIAYVVCFCSLACPRSVAPPRR